MSCGESSRTKWSRALVVALLSMSMGAREGLAAPETSEAAAAVPTEPVASSNAVPGLKVWIEPSVSDGESIQEWIEEQARTVLGERSRPLGGEDLIHVTLRGGPYEYRVYIALLRHKRMLEEQPEVIVCDCKTDDMLVRVAEGIAEGAERIEQAAEAERVARAWVAREEVEQPWERGSEEPSDGRPRTRRTLHPLGQAGIGVGVLGIGMMAIGIPFAVKPEQIRFVDGEFQIRDTRQPGLGLSISSGVVLAAGISMLIADLARQRDSSVIVVPAVGPQHAGVRVLTRF